MKQEIKADMAHFAEKPMAEKKALLAKYVSKITGTYNPVTEEYVPHFTFKISAPEIEELEWEPIKPSPVPPIKGDTLNPIRIKHARESTRRMKSGLPLYMAGLPPMPNASDPTVMAAKTLALSETPQADAHVS